MVLSAKNTGTFPGEQLVPAGTIFLRRHSCSPGMPGIQDHLTTSVIPPLPGETLAPGS
ncbi:MAG: hypothetical protein WKF91_06590 [Segetibacter sp.]